MTGLERFLDQFWNPVVLARYAPSILEGVGVTIALSLLIGRAILAASGRPGWSGIAPAVGFAAIMAVLGLLARVPGNREGLLLGLVALVAVSVFWLRRPAALGGEEETVAHWQIKRNGERRGIIEIVEEEP